MWLLLSFSSLAGTQKGEGPGYLRGREELQGFRQPAYGPRQRSSFRHPCQESQRGCRAGCGKEEVKIVTIELCKIKCLKRSMWECHDYDLIYFSWSSCRLGDLSHNRQVWSVLERTGWGSLFYRYKHGKIWFINYIKCVEITFTLLLLVPNYCQYQRVRSKNCRTVFGIWNLISTTT